MRIKLLVPPSKIGFDQIYPPLGLAKLTNLLRKKGHYVDQDDLQIKVLKYNLENIFKKKINTKILNDKKRIINHITGAKTDKKIEELTKKILKLTTYKNYDVVGFSALTTKQLLSSLLLAKKIKEETNAKIIIGGYTIDTLKIDPFKESKIIENILKNSKEKNFLDNINTKELDKQTPNFSGLPLKLYTNRNTKELVLPYQINKGCKYKCAFCKFNNPSKYYNTKKIIKDLKILKQKYQTNKFYFICSTINNNYKKLEEICDAIIKAKLNIKWSSFAVANNLDNNILTKMKQSGCYLLTFGIDSGSDRILKLMKKPFNTKQTSKILNNCNKLKIVVQTYFITGFPNETKTDIKKTINFIEKHKNIIKLIYILPFELINLTPIYENPKKHNITNLKKIDGSTQHSFDEINGLKWKEKQQQIKWSHKQTEKAAYYNIIRKSKLYPFPFKKIIPYWLFAKIKKQIVDNQTINTIFQKKFRYKQMIKNTIK